MSNVKHGHLTADREWRKHLRPYGKRDFWKQERQAQKRDARDRLQGRTDEGLPSSGARLMQP